MKETDKKQHSLDLQWIEAGTLTANPQNWRRHPPEQLQTLSDLIQDKEIGWAGVCLFNKRTNRLIDGHARVEVSDPKSLVPVPVLVGDWSEQAEQKILATLDPTAAMARGDADAYATLVQQLDVDSLWVRDLLHKTQQELTANADPDNGDEPDQTQNMALAEMELQPFEKYDYIMLLFRNDQDFQAACERLNIKKAKLTYPGGFTRVGLVRVMDGPKAMDILSKPGGRAAAPETNP